MCLVESSVICVFLQGYVFEIELYMYKTENIFSRLVLHFRQVNTWPPLTASAIDLHVLILQLYGPHLATVQLVLFEMFYIARFYAVIKRYDLLRSCFEKRTDIKPITELNYWCEQSTQRTQIEGCLFTCS